MMKESKYYLFIAFAIAVAIVLSACGSGSDSRSDSGSEAGSDNEDGDKGEASGEHVSNMIETAEIPTGDASLATDAASFIVFRQTMEGIYILDENDTPVRSTAAGEPEVSEDGKE